MNGEAALSEAVDRIGSTGKRRVAAHRPIAHHLVEDAQHPLDPAAGLRQVLVALDHLIGDLAAERVVGHRVDQREDRRVEVDHHLPLCGQARIADQQLEGPRRPARVLSRHGSERRVCASSHATKLRRRP